MTLPVVPSGQAAPVGDTDRVRTSDGAELHAVVAGEGPTVVLSHGALMSLEAWGPMWQPLLAAGHRLVGYDLRGHGRSTLGAGGFGVRAYGDDLAAVLDHFDVRGGTVVGHSTGGIGVLAHAVDDPVAAASRLSGAVLIAVPPHGLGAELQTRLLAPIVFSGLIDGLLRRRRLATPFTKTLFGPNPDPSVVDLARRIMAASPRDTKIGAPRAVLDFDFRERLGEIALPALVARGTRDTAVKAEDAAVLATRMPDAQLVELRHAGHLVVLERARELAAAIEAFVARSPVAGSPRPPV